MDARLFSIPLAVSLASFGVVALITHGILCLVGRVSTWKKFTAKQMLVSITVLFFANIAACARVIIRTAASILRWWVFCAVIFTLFSTIYVTYNEYPSVWVGAAGFYNANLGPWVHQTVVVPLKIVDVLLRGLLPIWNSSWWFLKAVGVQGLLPILIKEASIVLRIAQALINFITNTSAALFSFVDAFFCSGITCLHPERFVLDMLSGLADVRECVALSVELVKAFCGTLSAPVDLLLFPLLDLNLAEGLHSIINAAMHFFLVIPAQTVERCKLVSGAQFDILLCTPDLSPTINFLVAGVSSLGLAVDNWLNIAVLITQQALTNTTPRCDTIDSAQIPDLLASDPLFSGRDRVVVGLTDWLYAVTDGTTAVYKGHSDSGAKVQAWPYPMDASLGVAAVTYSRVHDLDVSSVSGGKTVGSMQTTSMMACNCTDTQAGAEILCSILPMTGVPTGSSMEDYLLQVLFPDQYTAAPMVCAGLDIYVKSSRWSFTRYESASASVGSGGARTTLKSTDCISRGTCRDVDATVWVIPRCGTGVWANKDRVCAPTAACMPFCMAARAAGSGRDNLFLSGTGQWRTGLTVLGQDCALKGSTPNTMQNSVPNGLSASRTEGSSRDILQSSIRTGVFGVAVEAQECVRALRVTSVVPKPPQVGGNVIAAGQPFVVTGDTLFTDVDLGGGASALQVERLAGDQSNVFSLTMINQHLPVEPKKLVVPAAEASYTGGERALLPISYQTARIAAVSSRNFVFYASNPDASVFEAYLDYCADRAKGSDQLGRFGIMVTSSYGPIRIYRVSAYRRCAAYSCGQDLVKFQTIPGFITNFTRSCDQTFNVKVMGLEYLNEDNIAVTVQVSTVSEFRSLTRDFAGPNTRTITLWLNPPTMAIQDTIWQTGVPTSSFTSLCPALQRLPRAGSFAAELVNSAVFLVKYALFAIFYTPGMIPVWRAGGSCPSVKEGTHYHSMLGNCGGDIFSLEDFFDSVEDAEAVFWHSLSLVAQFLEPVGGRLGTPMADVLEGMSKYGAGTVDLWAAKASVLTLTKVPIKDQLTQIWATMDSKGMQAQGASHVGGAITAWGRFGYKAVSEIALALAKILLTGKIKLTPPAVWNLVWNHMYDLRDYFSTVVTRKCRLGCGGLKLMMGLDNPWSDMIYFQCMSGAELTENLLSLGLNIFIQVPMSRCMCRDSAGRDAATFAVEQCAPSLPVSILPTLYSIANRIRGANNADKLLCSSVVDSVRSSISASMNPWFQNQMQALDALGSSVDYAMAAFQKSAGNCLDFQHDPHVVVIVPEPVDYFQRCAGTSRCKTVCGDEWVRFQEAQVQPVTLPSMNVVTESLFFPGALDSTLMLTNVSSSAEVEPAGICLERPALIPPDYALAVAEVAGDSISVQFWCAPRMASSSVYHNKALGYGATGLPGTVVTTSFGSKQADWMALMLQVADTPIVFMLNATGLFITQPIEPYLPLDTYLVRVANMWTIHGAILVDVLTRTLSGTDSISNTPSSSHLFMRIRTDTPSPNGTAYGGWEFTNVDLTPYGAGTYWYTLLADGTHLFLPKQGGSMPERLTFQLTTRSLSLVNKAVFMPADLSSLHGKTMSSISLGTTYVFATSSTGWDWLQQVRIGADFVDGVFNSAPVTMTIQTHGECNEWSCEGCPNVQVQRMCLAYGRCALMNCVGTPVHQRRPLCGVGALLKHVGTTSLLSTQAAWSVFSEMLGLTLQLTLMTTQDARLVWPEDKFLCSICQAKDGSAEFFSILTSTLNSALQLGGADMGYLYGGASNVDRNADAVTTISATALNAFLHQLMLAPLYFMLASHQITSCQTIGMIAVLTDNDFTLSLVPGRQFGLIQAGADVVAGQCLTVGAETMAKYPADNVPSLTRSVTSIAGNVVQQVVLRSVEPFLHYLDAALAYCIGVVKTLGALVTSQSMSLCNPPEFYLRDVVTCACGDQRLRIQPSRRSQGIPAHGLWCTGVLSMVDSNNQPFMIYNPYSYSELQALASGLQAYVDCVAGNNGYKCPVPDESTGVFLEQGVSLVNVLVKCRENYVKNVWDSAAYALFDYSRHHLIRTSRVLQVPDPDPEGVWNCFQADPTSGSLAKTCLQEYLRFTGTTPETYWAYERLTDSSLGPEFTDACLVFSGPASQSITPFTSCVDGPEDADATCPLSAHIWSPTSENSVPVASQHRVLYHGVGTDGLVQRLYRRARDTAVQALQDALYKMQSDFSNVTVEIFSVEGDVLHQTMDCMMMGPYSRVDYWPIPPCLPGEECISGPFWSRDDGNGASRSVDPNNCPSEARLPFTCGSPARRSLMRFLVKDKLSNPTKNASNKNMSLMASALSMYMTQLMADWNNTDGFGCLCSDNGTRLPSCCSLESDHVPPKLARDFTSIPTDNILVALEDDLEDMYGQALQDYSVWYSHLDPLEKEKYDWQTRRSQRAVDEARFNPVNPVRQYTSNEAMTPVSTPSSSLWDVCHASLKQVFFTLPSSPTGPIFDAAQFDGDPDRLEEYVRAFTARAFASSPLYRHYSPRHAPSKSQMCRSQPSAPDAQGSVTFDDFTQNGKSLLSGSNLFTAPVFGPQRFRVGEEACLCGWARSGASCLVPTESRQSVCQLVKCTPAGAYNISSERTLFTKFSTDWFCPDSELSPHWGFLDPAAAELWLTNRTSLKSSMRDLLTNGRSGLRIGNLDTLRSISKQYISPTKREVPLRNGILTTCEPGTAWSSDLTKAFIDELFPAAQAAEESGAMAYCLRYVIELARLTVLNMTAPEGQELSMQAVRTSTWAKRCGAQLQVVHLCVNLDAYRPSLPDLEQTRACPHFTVMSPLGRVIYATPACLVNADGVFYDPCICIQCAGDAARRLLPSEYERDECRIRFDPRRMIKDAPVGWIDGVPPGADETLLVDTFAQDVMRDPNAAGNTAQNETWWGSEGYMSDTGLFCDGVLDWWPDNWDYPVGYHVTAPCMAGDTAYRSFISSFALRNDPDGPSLVYQNDLLRNSTMADTNFGVGGLCRSSTFGMPMPETNTMRYCTSVPAGGGEDFTLPVTGGADSSSHAWSNFACMPSSRDLPWPNAESFPGPYDSARVSVGTVPNIPAPSSQTYPASLESMWTVGPWQDIAPARNWGRTEKTQCSDHELYMCQDNAACPPGFACRGRTCDLDNTKSCTNSSYCQGLKLGPCLGVCLDQAKVDCIMHQDCDSMGPDMMCSGMGTCETPVLAVQNRLERTGVALSLAAAGGCGDSAREYSMMGGSFWGHTGDDLLRVHGMCSFEDWFKYTAFTLSPQCSRITEDGYVDLDPTACPITDLESSSSNSTKWWSSGRSRPDLMYMRPTDCDRDYERLQGFQQCAPLPGSAVLLQDGGQARDLQFEQYVRMHANRTSIPLALMPFINNSNLGFAGLGDDINDLSMILGAQGALGDHPFLPCSVVGQCYPSPFTVNGAPANRTIDTNPLAPTQRRTLYPLDTPFKCGVFGIDAGDFCLLDQDVMPLYRYLCSDAGTRLTECTSLIPDVTSRCSNILERYTPSNSDRSSVLKGLSELFNSFPSFSDPYQYLDITSCMDAMYSDIQLRAHMHPDSLSTGLYYPMMFALYEFPFDWFYQCVVMAGVKIDAGSRDLQDCRAYTDRAKHGIASYQSVSQSGADPWDTYLRFVRGGYLTDDVASFLASQGRLAAAALQAARNSTLQYMFPSDGVDRTYPQCSANMLWAIGDYGDPYNAAHPYERDVRNIIWNWYNSKTCKSSWMVDVINTASATSHAFSPATLTTDNWIDLLTVADPDNMVPMYPTESIIQSIMDFVQGAWRLSFSPTVNSNINNQAATPGCMGFNGSFPATYNFETNPLAATLKMPAVMPVFPSSEVTFSDNLVSRTCVFVPRDDPAIPERDRSSCVNKDVRVSASRTDRLVACGGGSSICNTIPRAYLKAGKFACGYSAPRVIRLGCSVGNTNCENDVLRDIYETLKGNYGSSAQARFSLMPTQTLQWFTDADTDEWLFSGFDLSPSLDYGLNIQPNAAKTVMCQLNLDASKIIQFTQCHNPLYSALKQHVQKFYKHDGPVIVPALSQLEWKISRSMLSRGVILSYSNTNRSLDSTFVDALFDDASVCTGEVTGYERVCWKGMEKGQYIPINPWTEGMFNPFVMCDIEYGDASRGSKESIYSSCSPADEGKCQDFSNKQITSHCKQDHGSLVSVPSVPPFKNDKPLKYNLCHHTMPTNPGGCTHDQGLLGSFDGQTVASDPSTSGSMVDGTAYASSRYTVAPDMYTESSWEIPTDFRAGFWQGVNPLWEGKAAPYGHLQVRDTDIGGHRIGLVVSKAAATDTISTLLVERLPMQADDKIPLNDPRSSSGPVADWVPTLMQSIISEHNTNQRLYYSSRAVSPNATGASCPLQRWAFYSGNYLDFSPPIPSPLRAQKLFWRIHGGKLAHPTMTGVTDGRYLGSYKTSNGFCACPVVPDIEQQQCLVSTDDLTGKCSLAKTIESVRGLGGYLESYVFPPIDNSRRVRKCEMQLDWPNVNNPLRDGSTVAGDWREASSPSSQKCHVLDRFRSFRYRYTSVGQMQASGLNTIGSGACKTGRVVSLDGASLPAGARCVRSDLQSSSATFACTDTAQRTTLPRVAPQSLERVAMSRRFARQRCSACSPPPLFKTTGGAPMPPESSFGRLFRPSTERLLAKDLREALCNATGACPLFNETAWRRGSFMANYMTSPASLFLKGSAREAGSSTARTPEDPGLWSDQQWVYCPSAESLRTGIGCKGRMTRQTWTKDRARQCSRMVRSISTSSNATADPVARTSFCNIDRSTAAVCSAITTARGLLSEANGIAGGDTSLLPKPFAYHPASFDSSNNAWVYDTVRSFYSKIQPGSCPDTQDQSALNDFARKYQLTCPASPLYLVQKVLEVVRVVVTDVALILTTMLSMTLKLFGMLFTDQRALMKQYALADWSYLRRQSGEMMHSVSDMLVDALLNSGNMGLQIAGFLDKTCTQINWFINWFLNVWCNYIEEYMVQLMGGLREGMGVLGSGMDMLNDFMDEVFQGVLPEAFVAKYASSQFQRVIQERYSRPTAHNDKVKAHNNVPSKMNAVPKAISAAERNYKIDIRAALGVGSGAGVAKRIRITGNSRFSGLLNGFSNTDARTSSDALSAAQVAEGKSKSSYMSKAMSYGGKALGAAGAALEIYNIVSSIQSAAADYAAYQRLSQLYPQNFSLMDVSDIVNIIDDMQGFLLSDRSCYMFQSYQQANLTYKLFPCLSLSIEALSSNSSVPKTIAATKCWADAQPSLGQNSLFSCSSASSCCTTSVCSDFIPCGTCSSNTLSGISHFGCNGLRQMCVCNQPIYAIDSCSANGQCGPNSQCALVSSLNRVSYGTIPCSQCPSSSTVVCMLPPSGMPAQCSCVLDSSMQYDLCSDTTGSQTFLDSSRICGYLPGYPEDSSRWVFNMEDLVMMPCIQARSGVCSTVYLSPTHAIRMAVAATVRSGSGRRRLLGVEEPFSYSLDDEHGLLDEATMREVLALPGWERTASPCRDLATAHASGGALGVLETHELRVCAYWRHVGRIVIERHNLTALADHETFLLSWEDLAHTMMNPSALHALASNPLSLATAAVHHPLMKPLRVLGVLAANYVERLLWTLKSMRRERGGENRTRAGTQAEPDQEPEPEQEPEPGQDQEPEPDAPAEQARTRLSRKSRHLMSLQSDADAVREFSVQVIESAKAPALSPILAGSWSTSSFVWPPVYDFSLHACPAATSILHIGHQVLVINKLYFTNFKTPLPRIDRSLRATLPDVSWSLKAAAPKDPLKIPTLPKIPPRSWASYAFHSLLDAMHVTPDYLVAFFTINQKWSLQWMLDTAVHCDLASALTCSRHTKDMVMTVVVFGILFVAVSAIAGSLGITGATMAMLAGFPLFVLWYSFGLAPTCVPIIPTCLMSDVIAAVEQFVPSTIAFPDQLLCKPGDLGYVANGTCLLPCSTLNFTSWYDPLAFALCDTDPGMCNPWQPKSTGVQLLDSQLDPLSDSIRRFRDAIREPGFKPAGYRLCTWVNWIGTVLPLAVVVCLALLAGAVAVTLMELVPHLVEVISHMLVFFMTRE